MDTVSNKYHQHGRGTITQNDKPTGKEATKSVPVWLHKALIINNQLKQCKCGSIKHLRISSKDCPLGLAIRKAKKSALETASSKLEARKAPEDAAAEEERKCLAEEAGGKGGKSDEGASEGYVV